MYRRTLYNVSGDAFDKALVVAQVMRGEQIQGTAGEAVGPAMLTVPSTTTRSCSACAAGKWAARAMACTVIRHTLSACVLLIWQYCKCFHLYVHVLAFLNWLAI